jgi:hypothetical protein
LVIYSVSPAQDKVSASHIAEVNRPYAGHHSSRQNQ